MGLFSRKKPEPPRFSLEEYEPVLRQSICTGERTACMRERATGRLREVQLIRDEKDLEAFCAACGADPAEIKTIY
jgi:hypothetical protein